MSKSVSPLKNISPILFPNQTCTLLAMCYGQSLKNINVSSVSVSVYVTNARIQTQKRNKQTQEEKETKRKISAKHSTRKKAV